jgi:hypothetical protein
MSLLSPRVMKEHNMKPILLSLCVFCSVSGVFRSSVSAQSSYPFSGYEYGRNVRVDSIAPLIPSAHCISSTSLPSAVLPNGIVPSAVFPSTFISNTTIFNGAGSALGYVPLEVTVSTLLQHTLSGIGSNTQHQPILFPGATTHLIPVTVHPPVNLPLVPDYTQLFQHYLHVSSNPRGRRR